MFNVEYKKVKKSSIGLIIGLVFIIGMMIVFILENDSYNKILLNYNRVTISNEKKEIIEDINGEKITLTKVLNGKTYDKDGYVDMIIDKEDPKNNIIELEINRIGGNRKEDYYVEIYDELIKK